MDGCYQCGAPGGSSLQLCPECVARNEKKRDVLKKRIYAGPDTGFDGFLHRLFCDLRFQANALLIAWSVLAFVLVILGFEAGVQVSTSIFISVLISSFGLFLITLICSWLSLLVFDRVQAIIAILLPFMLYRLFFRMWRLRSENSEWYNHKGIILAHLLSLFLYTGAIMSIPVVGESAILRADRLFQKHYGFRPAKYFILSGIIRN